MTQYYVTAGVDGTMYDPNSGEIRPSSDKVILPTHRFDLDSKF